MKQKGFIGLILFIVALVFFIYFIYDQTKNFQQEAGTDIGEIRSKKGLE
ncbi:MAG TPA: hypothetical protein PJ997_02090 [Candidatus Paceibacterota bacterium]|nr:hypothetical protein [Candidatus Paceibacterota bacterium]HMP19106.1 hypothetical protein [Candidatus Paceibacterota bacterium]HMP85110.1 hypothetical protein [Candidatus Paceibacterota bacterium]